MCLSALSTICAPISNHHFLWQNLQLSCFLLSHVVRPLRMAMLENQADIVLESTGPILRPQKNVILTFLNRRFGTFSPLEPLRGS